MDQHKCDECGWASEESSDPEIKLMEHYCQEHGLSRGLSDRQERAIEIFRNMDGADRNT